MASTSGDVVVAADGTARLELGNPSVVNGLRIEQLAVLIAGETTEVTAVVFNGLPAASTQLSASSTGHDDVAAGPYFLPPGGFLTIIWTNATPGLTAQSWLTSSPIEIAPINLGTLRFSNPLTGSSTRLTTFQILNSSSIADGASETITVSPPAGRLWNLKQFSFVIDVAGGAGSHSLFVRQAITGLASPSGIEVMFLQYPGATDISFIDMEPQAGFTTRRPVDPMVTWSSLANAYATPTNPMYFIYLNNRGIATTATRQYRFVFLEQLA